MVGGGIWVVKVNNIGHLLPDETEIGTELGNLSFPIMHIKDVNCNSTYQLQTLSFSIDFTKVVNWISACKSCHLQ